MDMHHLNILMRCDLLGRDLGNENAPTNRRQARVSFLIHAKTLLRTSLWLSLLAMPLIQNLLYQSNVYKALLLPLQ